MGIVGEALVAVTGLFPDRPLRGSDGLAARALPGEWRAQVKAFFDQDRPRRFKLYPRPAHEAMLDRLTGGGPVADEDLVVKLASSDVIYDYLAVLRGARGYVKDRWPALSQDTFTGPRLLEPGATSMGAAWAIHAVVEDPSRLLVEMLSGTVQAAQVDAVKTVYPTLFQLLEQLIGERKAIEQGKKLSWSIDWPKERVLRILFGLPPDVAVKELGQQGAADGGDRSKVPQIDFASSQTRAQRIEAK
jgi:hypothetical protein